MMTTPHLATLASALALVGALALSACAANDSGAASLELTPVAAEGRSLASANGCGSCHGSAGQGGVGPAFVGLFGTVVELDDGSVIVADREYLIESINEPAIKKVDGFRLPMPTNRLTDDEVEQIVNYIEELAQPSEEVTP
jgi:cytochrome c oxidase subunit 2